MSADRHYSSSNPTGNKHKKPTTTTSRGSTQNTQPTPRKHEVTGSPPKSSRDAENEKANRALDRIDFEPLKIPTKNRMQNSELADQSFTNADSPGNRLVKVMLEGYANDKKKNK